MVRGDSRLQTTTADSPPDRARLLPDSQRLDHGLRPSIRDDIQDDPARKLFPQIKPRYVNHRGPRRGEFHMTPG